MIAKRWSEMVTRFVSVVGVSVSCVVMLSGCASMTSSKEELQSLGENEGIVVGSVLLTLPQEKANESGWAFLKGRKAGGIEYAVAVNKFNPAVAERRFIQVPDLLNITYILPATPGKEVYFVKKLPAGKYWIGNVKPTGHFMPDIAFPLGLTFYVKPQTLSYIGKLVVTLPDRLLSGSPVEFTVQDAQQEMIGRLGNDYPAILPKAVKELAERYRDPRVAAGRIADDKYYSARGWFTVPTPKPSNWAQAPFSVQDKSVANREANYEIVVFSVKDFGEILIAGVDHLSDDFIDKRMKQDDHRTVLSNLSTMALRFNTDVNGVSARVFPVLPRVIEETYLDTPHGEALFRVYWAEKGSLLARATGRAPAAADRFDTLIAVAVAVKQNNFIYAIAENDAESDGSEKNKEALKRRVQSFFTSISVHR